jgi:hypothetical protein
MSKTIPCFLVALLAACGGDDDGRGAAADLAADASPQMPVDGVDAASADAAPTSDAPSAGSCGEGGTATVGGSLAGHFDATGSAWLKAYPMGGAVDPYILVIDPQVGVACDLDPPEDPRSHLVVIFVDGRPAPGTYPILSLGDEDPDPTSGVYALIESGADGDEAIATGGTVVLESVDGCAKGTYDLTFGADGAFGAGTLSGELAAVTCD